MTRASQARLAGFIKQVNPFCKVDFHLGLGKLRQNQDEFVESYLSMIREGAELVI